MQIEKNSMYHSQYKQDQTLNELFFKNKKNGFFIDIGAYDGINLSNSYFFEKSLDWDGICVEPNPTVFEQLKKNRKAKCLNVGVWEEKKTLQFCKVSGPSEMLSGFVESYHVAHNHRVDHEIRTLGGSKEIIPIQCLSFMDIIKQNNVQKIDFMSIDVEGSEEKIICSIDFDQVEIDIIICENNYNETGISDFLKTKGFEHKGKIKIDDLFVRIQS
jgi:FkbM family methyltransferase